MEERKQLALRQAGQEYLERAMAPPSKPALPPRARLDDADFLAFGSVVEGAGSRLWLLACGCAVSQASAVVLSKGSLLYMPTPLVLLFMQLLAASVAMWLALGPPQLSVAVLRSAGLGAALHGAQMVCLMCALHQGSVFLVLAWTCAASAALDAAGDMWLRGQRPQSNVKRLGVVALALAAAVLEALLDKHRTASSLLLLMLWTAVKAGQQLWEHVKLDTSVVSLLPDKELAVKLRYCAEGDLELSWATRGWCQNALPALPALGLGLLLLEGRELSDHEPSVPALSVLLLSCLAHAAACCCRAALGGQLQGGSAALLSWATIMGTIAFDFLERAHTSGLQCLVAVTIAGAAAVGASLLVPPRQQQQQRDFP